MSGGELAGLAIAEARRLLDGREISSAELTADCLAVVDQADDLNAFTLKTPEVATEMAAAADARIARGEGGLLEGIPLAIKDLFCTRGIETTTASRILQGFVPTYESTVTANLFAEGAVMVGKTNMDEFAMGSSSENSAFGPVVNPWRAEGDNRALSPGGSSGGSAAAVAASLALGATGTDTGGSIRQPASLTGIVGCKPTYGRCSRWGVVAFSSSLDHPGPLARSVTDAAILLRAMSGHDPKDSTSADVPVPDFAAAIGGDLKGIKIGIPKEYRVDGMPDSVEALWSRGADWLREAGAEIVDITLPHTKYALPTYYIVAPAEASSNLARYDGVRFGLRVEGGDINEMYAATRGAGFGPEVRRRVLIGTYVLSAGYYDAYYLKAQRVRRLIRDDFEQVFKGVDAILTPTAPEAAFAIGAKSDDPIQMYLNDVFTVPGDLSGIPGISVPAGLASEGLPLGLQVMARAFDEETMFRVAGAIERAAGFDARPEPWWRRRA